MKFICTSCNFERNIESANESKYAGKSIACPRCKATGMVIDDAPPPAKVFAKKEEPKQQPKLVKEIESTIRAIFIVRLIAIILAFVGAFPIASNGQTEALMGYVILAFVYTLLICAVSGFAVCVLRYCIYRIDQ